MQVERAHGRDVSLSRGNIYYGLPSFSYEV